MTSLENFEHYFTRVWEINVTKGLKKTQLYSENDKTLMREIEDNTNKWKEIPCSGLGRITIVMMFIPPKEI